MFEQHAPEHFRQIIGAEYPRFARVQVNETGFKCYFQNNTEDRTPSSFCEGNRDRIVLQGRHGRGSDGITIGTSPNQIFDWIVSLHRNDGDASPDDWIMRRYKAAVHDREALARFLDQNMIDIVIPRQTSVAPGWIAKMLVTREDPNTHVLIRGPQGCGKSTKIMRAIPMIYERDPGVIFFSSPSIAQAQEKSETFARLNQDDRFVPYLYLSLTALYERSCPEPDRITHQEILEEGGASWLHAVYERQREIYDEMFEYRCRLLDIRADGKVPVLFGTHETVRQHADEGLTRIFYARNFGDGWFEPLPKEERAKLKRELLRQNDFHRVIFDEVTAHDLMTIHPYGLVEWTQRYAEDIGFDCMEDIAERYKRFATYLSENPCAGMTWNEFIAVLKCDYEDEHVFEVSDREIPFDDRKGIYGQMVAQRYYVQTRSWWNAFSRVTMLTTEAVPTRIVEAIDREASNLGELQDDRIKIYEFGLPDSARDVVLVELQRGCKKETLPELVGAYHTAFPGAEIISDMVRNKISEFSVSTHMAAKGSNAYINSDVIAFYNALSPALFGELGALNTRFGRSDVVRLFYVDRFEQTAGRNRGFRGEQGREHIAVFPPRLNSWLAPAMTSAGYVRATRASQVQVGQADRCEINV